MTANTLLHQGIAAAQAGNREEARALLMRLVETDEHSEQGWLWLAGVLDDPEEIRVCLENVLALNPANAQAQQGLAWVEKRYGRRATDHGSTTTDHGSTTTDHGSTTTDHGSTTTDHG
ncbi:MAG: hypothetical protein RLZZ387_3368, partial [Chloroflexota bacterium]